MVENIEDAVELIVDAEDLIAEIHSRPEIWDIESQNYSNRDIRKQKWEEVVEVLLKVENATSEMKTKFGK